MKKYFVKTRNWHGDKRVLKWLQLVNATRADSYDDGDAKLYIETDSLLRALAVGIYWKLFSRWTGGWTYVEDTTKNYSKADYKFLYL